MSASTHDRCAADPESVDASLLAILEAVAFADDWFDGSLMEALPAPPPHDNNCEPYERHVPGDVVRYISALFFTFAASGVDNADVMAGVIASHNSAMRRRLGNLEMQKRWRLSSKRFEFAIFPKGASNNVLANLGLLGKLALDGTSIARFLSPQCNRNSVFEALEVLRVAGALFSMEGAYNSRVYVSAGILEKLYAEYLVRLREAVISAEEVRR